MSANQYYATVTRVIDGDTFVVKDKFGNNQTIRLFGVDTPEKKQPFGMTAKEYTSNLIDKKQVYIDAIDLGKYNRVVAIVYINNYSIGEILVEEGIAFADGYNHKLAKRYYSLQEKARVNSKGVHKLGIQSPAEFRKQNQFFRNPSFIKSKNPVRTPVKRIKPSQPNILTLQKVKDFFTKLLIKDPEQVAKKAAIKKEELERIEKRKADRKREDAIKENLKKIETEKQKQKESIDHQVAQVDTSKIVKKFNERCKNM